jgi:hypothetical protein
MRHARYCHEHNFSDMECKIMRKTMIAMTAAAALGAATMATAAFAAPHGGGGGGAHFGGGGGGAHFGGGGGAPMARGNVGGGGGFAAPRGNFGAANMGRPGGSANFARSAPGNFAGTGGNFAARGFDRDHRRGGFGFGGLYAFGAPTYYDYYDNYDNSYGDNCWQQQLVPTPYGSQWQMVDVCQQ